MSALVTSLAEVWIEIRCLVLKLCRCSVTSLAEVWIEIPFRIASLSFAIVTSLAEVWIEIGYFGLIQQRLYQSLPLRKCGLKCKSFGMRTTVYRHFPCGSVD